MKKHVLGQSARSAAIRTTTSAPRAAARRSGDAGISSSVCAWSMSRCARTLALARRTDYGTIGARWPTTLQDWPLLDKETAASRSARRSPPAQTWLVGAGHHRRHQRRAAAACCARSQAIVLRAGDHRSRDRQSVGCGRAHRTDCVLRGDNPHDIDVSPNPECEIIDGGAHA